jgi:hypothetical protein
LIKLKTVIMKKYLLSLALVSAMICGTSTVLAGTPKKAAPAKTEQTATVKKAAAKDAKCDAKCNKKCAKKCTKKCTAKCAKKAAPAKAAPAKK